MMQHTSEPLIEHPDWDFAHNLQSSPLLSLATMTLYAIWTAITVVVVLVATVILMAWFLLGPKPPNFEVREMYFTQKPEIPAKSSIKIDCFMRVGMRNMAGNMSLNLYSLNLTLLQGFTEISNSSMGQPALPLRIDSLQEGTVSTTFNIHLTDPLSVEFFFIENNVGTGYMVRTVRLRVVGWVTYEREDWEMKRQMIKVFCGGMYLKINSTHPSGILSGKHRTCKVFV
uniref:Protein YLS9-like n=1 Tax=Nelumbo nucifera TaxID=4432 RepID=A0A822ZZZ6_NELNU|nr:TPA_asm: hypothetical protein HUJ06_018323 [Nelumbo nucifera]